MQHPFQCIATIKPPTVETDSPGYLLAACGTKLSSICLTKGDVVCKWSSEGATESTSLAGTLEDEDNRPTKKQKALQANTDGATHSNIIRLAVSPNHEYVVAVTDDKCVRVFSFHSNGDLRELSSRHMPKRPCAIQILPDNATILCGDKFGDVYSLPLLPAIQIHNGEEIHKSINNDEEPESKVDQLKPFKPAATDKTVHTQRNLKSLASQQNQKNLTPKTKEPLKFEHKLLLGHVSMLTDLAYATCEIEGKIRRYIITADRDEHIRVSRAPPQSHIIEGYCLGHREFISKIRLIPGTNLLVSGGGDSWLGVWEWSEFTLRHRLALSEIFNTDSIAVSGIWIVPMEQEYFVVVACEKSPILACVSVDDLTHEKCDRRIYVLGDFKHSILDVVSFDNTVLVSFDVRGNEEKRLRAFNLQRAKTGEIQVVSDYMMDSKLEYGNTITGVASDEKSLDSLLHGIENLRKRGYHDEMEIEDGSVEQPS